MNHAYRLIWNHLRQRFIAVPETARTHGKAAGGLKLLPLLLLLVGAQAHANPTGGQVTAGQGVINQTTSTTTVNQASQNLAINWQSFNIGQGEKVVFVQPNASSIALNRVIGNEASKIYGVMQANGQVFLINSNGVLFSKTAQVDVGGLVASTLNLSDADFMAGKRTFSGDGAAVVNQGSLKAANGGYVALLGSQAINEGVISAQLGTVALAAGKTVTLAFNGNKLANVQVDEATLAALASNKQLIQADGGTVYLTAKAKDALMNTVVNNSGIIEARSINEQNGSIWLEGGAEGGVVQNSGTLDASGRGAGQTGGQVRVLGKYVGLLSGSTVDVSGDQGGGTALIGGNYQGSGSEQKAKATYVDKNAVIKADALSNGNGGKVVVWADDSTRFYGTISANGGAKGGNGGTVEVSGKKWLDFNGKVSTLAPRGKVGSLLLDPDDINICETCAEANLGEASGVYSSSGGTSSIKWSTLETALTGTTVTVQTGTGGNINIQESYNFSTNGTAAGILKLDSGGNITATTGLTLTGQTGLSIYLKSAGTMNLDTNFRYFENLTFNNTANSIFTGQLDGNSSKGVLNVIKEGNGKLTISSPWGNWYEGSTTINAGTIEVTADGAFGGVWWGTGNVTVNTGGTVAFSGDVNYTSPKPIILNGGKLVNTSGNNKFYGPITLQQAGSIQSNDSTGSLTLYGAINNGGKTLTFSGDGATKVISGVVAGNADTADYTGIISGAGALVKNGDGVLTLGGANTYTGTTTVNAGTVAVTVNDALGLATGGSVTVASTGTLDIQGGVNYSSAKAVTLDGGKLVSTSGANKFNGPITLKQASTIEAKASDGSLTLYGAIDNGGKTLNVGGVGVVRVVSGVDSTNATTLANTKALTGVISGSGDLVKFGIGTVELGGANTYTGTTSIDAGVLKAVSADVIANTGAVTVKTGATYDLNNNNETIKTFSGGGVLARGTGNLTITGTNSFTGTCTGTGTGGCGSSGGGTGGGTGGGSTGGGTGGGTDTGGGGTGGTTGGGSSSDIANGSGGSIGFQSFSTAGVALGSVVIPGVGQQNGDLDVAIRNQVNQRLPGVITGELPSSGPSSAIAIVGAGMRMPDSGQSLSEQQ